METISEPSLLALTSAVILFVGTLWLFLFMLLVCRGKFWKKLLLTIVLTAIGGITEFLTLGIFSFAGRNMVEYRYDSLGVIGPLVAIVICALLCSALLIFWKWKKAEARENHVNFGFFLLLPISQVVLLFGTVYVSAQHGYVFSVFIFIGALIGVAANLILLRMLFANAEKNELEHRVRELEQIHEMERARFESIETRQYELAKIRHDFNNQLVAAFRLVEQSKQEEAVGMLDALSTALMGINEKTYCENHVVNAVLTEKQTACENADVKLDANVVIAENCGIEPLHLCSVFSNLLDNALNACRNVSSGVITITAAQRGDYLHIKCLNPAPVEKRGVKTRRGYGTRILSDIAEQYDGAYRAENAMGQYCAVVSLMCSS